MQANVDGAFCMHQGRSGSMQSLVPPVPRAIASVTSLMSMRHIRVRSPTAHPSKAARVHFSTSVANLLQKGNIPVNTVSAGMTSVYFSGTLVLYPETL